jgi:Rne/Rng family ribonuclease
MYKELIINATPHETRVALLEDGTIVELFVDRGDDDNIAGNIYKGKVQRVLPGMQAAFVDIGLNQAAFIYVDDVIGENYQDIEALFLNGDENGEIEETTTLDYYAPNFKGSYDWLISWIFHLKQSEINLVEDETFPYDYQVILGEDFDPCLNQLFAPQAFLP